MTSTYTLSPTVGSEINYLIPAIAPYYVDSLSVSIVATAKSWCGAQIGVSTPLVMGIDWEPSLRFESATAELGAPVYYAISFIDTSLAGTVTVNGNTADASYAPTAAQITQFTNSGKDPLVTNWETYFKITTPYPSTNLSYSTTNAQKITAVISAINAFSSNVANGGKTSIFNFNNHIGNAANPHITTASIIGLGAVPNWTTGTVSDIVNGNATAFITPYSAFNAVTALLTQATNTTYGSYLLNNGSSDVDANKALTAAGLVALISSGTANAINAYFNKPKTAVQFSPFPIAYPAKWKGTNYTTFSDLVSAVKTFTGISNLVYSDPLGTIWFPNGIVPPSLVLG